jgi:ribosomal protein S18 acetylase RimI-like enzyme
MIHASKDDYALFVVENSQGIIGLFDLYDGYPTIGTGWISLLLLDIEFRGKGIGKILCNLIAEECRTYGFDSVGLAVSMNNRIALKFWVNLGFKEILGIYGDLKYPVMGLKQTLK